MHDGYRDKDIWAREVMKSAMRHAADRLESEECRKTPEVFLAWVASLSNHLYRHYTDLDGDGDG